MFNRIAVYLSFVRFSHSVFALPFALAGALLAAQHVSVGWGTLGWILVAMVAARSAAMGFNRLVDARFDALNPRTANRELPRGAMSHVEASMFIVVSSSLFVFAAWRLNPICFALSPMALAIVFWYSLAKRVTTWTQLFLGLAMAVAPVGGWLAVGGRGGWEPWLLALAIGTWVGGFDVLYACQDLDFDRVNGLHSIPVRFGVPASLAVSRAMHVVTIACLLALPLVMPLGIVYLVGVGVVAALLVYEQSLVRADDLSQVKRAFDLNGYVGILYLLVLVVALYSPVTEPLHVERSAMTDVSKSPARIAGMFDAIAERYDFLNHLLSAGIDRRWRTRAIASLKLTGRERVLDVCTGTADLAIAATTATPGAASVVGVDFSGAMLHVGHTKVRRQGLEGRVSLVRGDAAELPVADETVDAITVAFGIRNVENTAAGCREMYRVLRPGGRLAILEFAIPTAPLIRQSYLWYFNHVLPRIGRLVSRHSGAYGYLPASVGAFATPDEFVTILQRSGFVEVSAVRLTLGIVCLYTARRR